MFSFRRMTRPQWLMYVDDATARPARAREHAVRCCLDDASGSEFKLDRGGSEKGVLSDKDLERLRSLVGDDGMNEIGQMAVAISRSLLAEEKKP